MTDYLTRHQVLNGRVSQDGNTCSTMKGYEPITVHPGKKYKYNSLSPYTLKDGKARLVENVWQFSKVYEKVSKQEQFGYVVGHQGRVLKWSYPEEVHLVRDYDGDWKTTPEYWKWRKMGMHHSVGVRYPNGYNGRHNCITSLWKSPAGEWLNLDYVESRRKIYSPCMVAALLDSTDTEVQQQVTLLKKMYRRGEKMIFSEVDGPSYAPTFPYNQVQRGELGIEGIDLLPCTKKNIRSAIENTDRPFGHGYIVACVVIGKEQWLV